MAYEETLRLLLQNKFDRIENLVKMNHAATLAVPTVLAAIWGISRDYNMIPILCLISIGLLLFWRYFAHYLDDDITKSYIEILRFENLLGVPREVSIFNKIVKDPFTEYQNRSISDDYRIKKLEYLYENKKMGYRGHDKWDNLAFILIGLILAFFLLYPYFLKFNVVIITIIGIFCVFSFYLVKGLFYYFLSKEKLLQTDLNDADSKLLEVFEKSIK
jgi:hypothetical protein